jgi:putative sterol carrier protein
MKRGPAALLLATVLVLHAVPGEGAANRRGDDVVPQQVFDGMRQSFVPARARGVHARYQFNLSGANGGLWWIEVSDAKCRIGRGRIRDPGVTLIASDRDWVALSNGKLPGFWAFLTGRLKIQGDQQLARQLDEIFP